MAQHFGISIDPGMSSGICMFSWGTREPFKVVDLLQFGGGAKQLSRVVDAIGLKAVGDCLAIGNGVVDALVVERFTPRQNQGFNLTRAAVEPLRAEGVLIAKELEPLISWAEPGQQYFMGGADLRAKKAAGVRFLKDHSFYRTGGQLGQPDSHDATSATLHAIAYLRRMRHMPTINQLFPDTQGAS